MSAPDYAPEVPDAVSALARIDRELQWLDGAMDRALDAMNLGRAGALDDLQRHLRRRGELLAARNDLGGSSEPPC